MKRRENAGAQMEQGSVLRKVMVGPQKEKIDENL